MTDTWRTWDPPLLRMDDLSMSDVRRTWPAGITVVPWIVWVLENPRSPLCLPGGVRMRRHDSIHIILSRGLQLQDEAFVVGLTMGSSDGMRVGDGLSKFWEEVYLYVSQEWYPRPYRFRPSDAIVYRHGVKVGRTHCNTPLGKRAIENAIGVSVNKLGRKIGLAPEVLAEAYAEEIALVPFTLESKRLLQKIKPFLTKARFEELSCVVDASTKGT